ncbi:MAG: hypothetical protein HY543_01345, partial [Deltaproteobacteria bacterium]|nr:hypothetical protein [Deltaproteobacteria bacterium]
MNLLLLGYAIPCLRLLLRAMGRPRYARWRRRVNYPIGCLEWAIQSVRDSLGLVAWTAWLGYAAWLSAVPRLGLAAQAAPPAWPSLAIGAAAVGLSLAARRMKRAHRVRLLAYAARFPRIQPGEYFQAFFAGFGPLPLALPDDPPLRTLPTLDFRRGKKARLRVWPVLHGAFSTSFIARQMFLARRVHGPAGAMPSLDGLMQIWGARMMLLGRLRVIVEGIERAAQIRGQCVLCFNHKSALDFAVALAVLGLIDFPHRPPWRIRFLAARDHFLDNWFFYRGIGIGRAIEIAGMIFVNRRGTPEERRQAIAD